MNSPEPPAGDPWCRFGDFCDDCGEAFIKDRDNDRCRECRSQQAATERNNDSNTGEKE